MKLFGSKGKGKRVQKSGTSKGSVTNKSSAVSRESYNEAETRVIEHSDIRVDEHTGKPERLGKPERSERMSTKKKVALVIAIIVGLMLLLGATTLAVVRWEIQPFYDYFFRPGENVLAEQPAPRPVGVDIENPDRPVLTDQLTETDDDDDDEQEEVVEEITTRDMNKFTFLILGIDLYGNTDVIMVATFDALKSTLEVVSIPRDTVVNVPWDLRKINSIHAYARNQFSGQNVASDDIVNETVGHFRNFLGYNIDFMITISMGAFPRIVNAIGPIEFNVPRSVNLEGVTVSRGVQRLNGQQALAVMRDRNAHSDGDIGRATTQQEFLNTIMKQFLARRSSIKVNDMADIFLRHTNTNIPLNNLVWLGNEFLKMDAENINFSMMPGNFETIRGNFYITVQLEPWLEIVNEKLSPLNREITAEDVSILTRGPDRVLYVTDGNWLGSSSWGASSRGTSNPQTTTGRHEP